MKKVTGTSVSFAALRAILTLPDLNSQPWSDVLVLINKKVQDLSCCTGTVLHIQVPCNCMLCAGSLLPGAGEPVLAAPLRLRRQPRHSRCWRSLGAEHSHGQWSGCFGRVLRSKFSYCSDFREDMIFKHKPFLGMGGGISERYLHFIPVQCMGSTEEKYLYLGSFLCCKTV